MSLFDWNGVVIMQNQKGLSLLEVLVAMIVLAIGLLGFAPMVVMSIEGNNMSRDALEVTQLAKNKLELYENASLIPALPYEETETGLSGGYDRFTRMWDNSTDTLLPEGLCEIQVVISWQDKVGVSRSATYSSLVDKF
jgi:type IV pilus assembly protein PilV